MSNIEDVLKNVMGYKLLKKNNSFRWMNEYLFYENGDVYFGNLQYLIRLVKAHDGETKSFSLTGDELEETSVKVYELWTKAMSAIRERKPLLNAVSNPKDDINSFDKMRKFLDKGDNCLCHIKNKHVTLEYIEWLEEGVVEGDRCSVRINWEVDRDEVYYTFLDPKTIISLLKSFGEDTERIKWIFFEDPLPHLMVSERVQIMVFNPKEIPSYFEEYTKKPSKRKGKTKKEDLDI